MPEKNKLYDELTAILNAEMECAESLHATTTKIQTLIDADKYNPVQAKLVARGEIINLMFSLDKQACDLITRFPDLLDGEQKKKISGVIDRFRGLMISNINLGRISQESLEKKGNEVSQSLKSLFDGKKIVNSYGKNFKKKVAHPVYNT